MNLEKSLWHATSAFLIVSLQEGGRQWSHYWLPLECPVHAECPLECPLECPVHAEFLSLTQFLTVKALFVDISSQDFRNLTTIWNVKEWGRR